MLSPPHAVRDLPDSAIPALFVRRTNQGVKPAYGFQK